MSKKKDEKMRGGLEALIGGGRTAPASSTERSAEEAYQEELLLLEKEQAPTDGAEAMEEATPQEEEELISSIQDETLRAALRQRQNRKRGRPRKDAALRRKYEEVYTRSCWIMRRDQIAKLKEISFRETLTIKEIMEKIVGDAIKAYEDIHGEVVPKDHRGDASKLFE